MFHLLETRKTEHTLHVSLLGDVVCVEKNMPNQHLQIILENSFVLFGSRSPRKRNVLLNVHKVYQVSSVIIVGQKYQRYLVDVFYRFFVHFRNGFLIITLIFKITFLSCLLFQKHLNKMWKELILTSKSKLWLPSKWFFLFF